MNFAGGRSGVFSGHFADHRVQLYVVGRMPDQKIATTGFGQCEECTGVDSAKVVGEICGEGQSEEMLIFRALLNAEMGVEGEFGDFDHFDIRLPIVSDLGLNGVRDFFGELKTIWAEHEIVFSSG